MKTYLRFIGGGILSIFVIGLFLLPTTDVSGRVGVGVGAGEINLTDDIKPGGIYELPNLRIFNTGDETTTYKMNVAYHQDYHQLRPGKSWFSFNPETFTLPPGESQEILISMIVPVKAEQGEYFAFLESGPVISNEPGTSVGIAAATKLFFTMVPANIWQATLQRVSSFFATYAPWSWIGLGITIVIIIFVLFKKFFSFNIAMKKK